MKEKDTDDLFIQEGGKKMTSGNQRCTIQSPKHNKRDRFKDIEPNLTGENIGGDLRKHTEGSFPVTWLPAMVLSNENQTGYILEHSEKLGPELIQTGTLVQLPSSYNSGSNNGKMYGLVVGPNTVVPLDSMSFANIAGFDKMTNLNTNESNGINEQIKNISKIENSDIGVGEQARNRMTYNNVGVDISQKETFYCVYCQQICKDVMDLQTHIMNEHSENPPISSYLSDPNNIHPSLRTCPGCGHQLRRSNTFSASDYTLGHNDEEQNLDLSQGTGILMMCENCGKEYTLGLAPESTTQYGTPNQDSGKRHYCDHCDKSYKHNRDLRKHLRSHHGVETISTPSNTSNTMNVSYQCDNVNQQTTVNSQTYNTNPPSNKIVCQQCKKMFRGPFELRRHIHTVHENKRPYKCPDCSKFFRDAYELKRHSASHQRLHYHSLGNSNITTDSSSHDIITGNIQHSSSGDVHGNTTNNNNNQNVNRMVSGSGLIRGEMYTQSQTPTQFANSTQAYDYFCGTCEKNFRGANEFRRHYSVVHEKKYRYKCLHCGKLWRDQYDLKRHCRRSHFVDREIDRAFIRQCLLESNEPAQSQDTIGISNFNIAQQVTLTLNQEAANAIFGTNDQEVHAATNHLDSNFPIMSSNSISIPHSSPTGGMFPTLPSIQPATMLYHNNDPTHLVENMIQQTDSEAIQEETKNAVNWSNFESDIQPQK